MIDFSLKFSKQAAGALNMGLRPGSGAEKEPSGNALYIAEAAFNILEPSIRKHSTKYARSFSHWGVTEISRAEWKSIIDDWEKLKRSLLIANSLEEVSGIGALTGEGTNIFEDDFVAMRAGLINMIDELAVWLHAELRTYDRISVLGI
jgi:hypothetical protein